MRRLAGCMVFSFLAYHATANGTNEPFFTPSPAPTITPIPELSVSLIMTEDFFTPGDECGLAALIRNPGPPIPSLPLAAVLDYHGQYFMWPSWGQFPPILDYMDVSIPSGESFQVIIQPFIWPEGAGSDTGICFTAAVLSHSLDEILGIPDTLCFGFGQSARRIGRSI